MDRLDSASGSLDRETDGDSGTDKQTDRQTTMYMHPVSVGACRSTDTCAHDKHRICFMKQIESSGYHSECC